MFDKQLKMKEISATREGLLNATMTSIVAGKYPIMIRYSNFIGLQAILSGAQVFILF